MFPFLVAPENKLTYDWLLEGPQVMISQTSSAPSSLKKTLTSEEPPQYQSWERNDYMHNGQSLIIQHTSETKSIHVSHRTPTGVLH